MYISDAATLIPVIMIGTWDHPMTINAECCLPNLFSPTSLSAHIAVSKTGAILTFIPKRTLCIRIRECDERFYSDQKSWTQLFTASLS